MALIQVFEDMGLRLTCACRCWSSAAREAASRSAAWSSYRTA